MNFVNMGMANIISPSLKTKLQNEQKLAEIGVEAHLDINTPEGNEVYVEHLIQDHNEGRYVPRRFYTNWREYAQDTNCKKERNSQAFGGEYHPSSDSAFVPADNRTFLIEKGAIERGFIAGTIYDHEVHGHGEIFQKLKGKYGEEKAGKVLLMLHNIKLQPSNLNTAEAVSKYAAYDFTKVRSLKDLGPQHINTLNEFIAETTSAQRSGRQIPQEAIDLKNRFRNKFCVNLNLRD